MTAIIREWLCWDNYSDISEREGTSGGNTHECGVLQDLLTSTAAVSEYSVFGTPVRSNVRKDVQIVPGIIKLSRAWMPFSKPLPSTADIIGL